jgi:hypothetical protein
LSERFTTFFDHLGEAWDKVLSGDFAGAWKSFTTGLTAGITGKIEVPATEYNSPYDANGNFKTGFEAQRTAVIKEIGSANITDITALIAGIDERMQNIRSEIAYNRALQN